MTVMPALNINFSDKELANLRARAAAKGVSMRVLAHDTIVSDGCQEEEDRKIAAVIARVRNASRDLLESLAGK